MRRTIRLLRSPRRSSPSQPITPSPMPSPALADANAKGWLRQRWRPGDPGDLTQTPALDAATRDIAADPLAVTACRGHGHYCRCG